MLPLRRTSTMIVAFFGIGLGMPPYALAYVEGDSCLVAGHLSRYRNGVCSLPLKDRSCGGRSGSVRCNSAVFGQQSKSKSNEASPSASNRQEYCVSLSEPNMTQACALLAAGFTLKSDSQQREAAKVELAKVGLVEFLRTRINSKTPSANDPVPDAAKQVCEGLAGYQRWKGKSLAEIQSEILNGPHDREERGMHALDLMLCYGTQTRSPPSVESAPSNASASANPSATPLPPSTVEGMTQLSDALPCPEPRTHEEDLKEKGARWNRIAQASSILHTLIPTDLCQGHFGEKPPYRLDQQTLFDTVNRERSKRADLFTQVEASLDKIHPGLRLEPLLQTISSAHCSREETLVFDFNPYFVNPLFGGLPVSEIARCKASLKPVDRVQTPAPSCAHRQKQAAIALEIQKQHLEEQVSKIISPNICTQPIMERLSGEPLRARLHEKIPESVLKRQLTTRTGFPNLGEDEPFVFPKSEVFVFQKAVPHIQKIWCSSSRTLLQVEVDPKAVESLTGYQPIECYSKVEELLISRIPRPTSSDLSSTCSSSAQQNERLQQLMSYRMAHQEKAIALFRQLKIAMQQTLTDSVCGYCTKEGSCPYNNNKKPWSQHDIQRFQLKHFEIFDSTFRSSMDPFKNQIEPKRALTFLNGWRCNSLVAEDVEINPFAFATYFLEKNPLRYPKSEPCTTATNCTNCD